MRGTRLPALALIVGLIVVTAAVVLTIDPMSPPSPSAGNSSSAASSAPPPGPSGEALLEAEASGVGPDFPILDGVRGPTLDVMQSKLWVHDGAWWGLLVAGESQEFRIHRFDWSERRWIDTGTRVAPRSAANPDVIAEGGMLWVATGGGQPTPSRLSALSRFTYDDAAARYVPDSDFPVTIAGERGRSLTIARDDGGRLWAAWIGEDGLRVSHTDGSDWRWAPSSVPAIPSEPKGPAAVALVSYGETVALVWSNQEDDDVVIAWPRADDPEEWEHVTAVVEGLRPAGDDLGVAVLETDGGPQLFVALRTSAHELPGADPGDPQVILLVVEPSRETRQYLVGRIADDLARPIVLVDGENEIVYVVATHSGDRDTIIFKASRLDDIDFPPGPGTALIEVEELAAVGNPTSTKQTLSSATGLLVLAADAEAGSYAWSVGRLPGMDEPNIAAVGEFSPAPGPILFDTFDPFEPGSVLDPMWEARGSGDAAFQIVDTGDGRRVASAAATGGATVRICRAVAPVGDGRLRVEADVMLSRVGVTDASITSVRNEGSQTAVVRFDNTGVFSYFDGDTQVRSTVRFTTGMWYTSEVVLDIDSKTYDWRMQRASDQVTVLSVQGAKWRVTTTNPISDICFESPEAAGAAPTLAVDRVLVAR